MAAPRQSCLFVLTSANEGVSAQSFVQAYNISSPNLNIQLASPGGKHIEYVNQDETNRRWFNEFRAKSSSNPIALETIDSARYSALVIPDSPGAVRDLYNDPDLKQILISFVKDKKPICAIGMGVAGLFPAHVNNQWCFEDYSMTSTSLYELARNSDFPNLPVIPEDYIKDNLAKYSCSGEPDSVHVVVDRHLITGQNIQSTITAVQNLILMCNQKNTGRLSPRV
ncbi:Glutamine amidotransferase-like class 1 domain-containing protein 1 [Mactra antiquata]